MAQATSGKHPDDCICNGDGCQCKTGPLLTAVLDQEERRTLALESIAASLERLAWPMWQVNFGGDPLPVPSFGGNMWECMVCHRWTMNGNTHECPGLNVC